MKAMLESFLFDVHDQRRKQGRRYQLGHILLFSIFAILCHANSYRKIHQFIKNRYQILKEEFKLDWKRVPAYTTIRNIISTVSPSSLEESFRNYSLALINPDTSKHCIALDGKVLRGSFDHFQGQEAIQILSVFATDTKIILAHQEIADKTNEIPTAQALIPKLGLENCIFTFDAINCQDKTLEAAKATNNDVIVQVKGNQKTLLKDCISVSETMPPTQVYDEPLHKERNRIESRRAEVFENIKISDHEKWNRVNTIVKVDRKRQIFNTKTRQWQNTDETSYYIATISLRAAEFCEVIRNHWSIENTNHYVRDVTMDEDKSRIRVNPNIFAKLRSFALNILRANQVKNVSAERYDNCLNFEKVLHYWGIRKN
jgi:predicted transposase YbfD/YdcC